MPEFVETLDERIEWRSAVRGSAVKEVVLEQIAFRRDPHYVQQELVAFEARLRHPSLTNQPTVPIDSETLTRLRTSWGRLKSNLIREVDQDYGVFIPVDAKVIDTATEFGRTILDAAERAGVEPERLAEAVDLVRRREIESPK